LAIGRLDIVGGERQGSAESALGLCDDPRQPDSAFRPILFPTLHCQSCSFYRSIVAVLDAAYRAVAELKVLGGFYDASATRQHRSHLIGGFFVEPWAPKGLSRFCALLPRALNANCDALLQHLALERGNPGEDCKNQLAHDACAVDILLLDE
jgi:hypothetical protein